MAQSPHGASEPVPADLMSAELLGKRIGETTLRWVKGQS